MASTTDALGTTTWSYDLAGRPLRKTLPDGRFIGWNYDADGRITERSTPAGTVRYAYDAKGQLASVTDPEGRSTGYSWNDAGELTRVAYPNGTETRSAYDTNGRLTQKAHLKTVGGSLIAASRYGYSNGQRSQVEVFDGASTATEVDGTLQLDNPAHSTTYAYDELQRLVGETRTQRGSPETRETAYTYDAVANRRQRTQTNSAGTVTTDYGYDANDRLTTETTTDALGAVSTSSYTWDDNGNLRAKTTASGVTLYGRDAENRLIEVKRGADEASVATVATYAYDADGLRVRRTEPGTPPKVTDYLTDPSFPFAKVLEETETLGASTETTHYVWGAELIEQLRSGQGTFYHADALGSVKALTDETGSTSDLYEYEAFGKLAQHAGSSGNAYRYTGEYFDDVIGLQYNRARWYSAGVGRWSAMDPHPGVMGRPISLNDYVYAANTKPYVG
ncbi:MAG: RHS repeat-associated core domain-containing protein [Rhodocyclaceae bacterium]|nr:RHS repeat-associated core domain-containing protein [Rhodocyclaceae bacterium]